MNFWNQKKIFHLKYQKSAKIEEYLGLFNSGWACSNVFACGNMKHAWNAM